MEEHNDLGLLGLATKGVSPTTVSPAIQLGSWPKPGQLHGNNVRGFAKAMSSPNFLAVIQQVGEDLGLNLYLNI